MVLPEFLDRMNVSHPIEYRYTCSFVVDKVLYGNTYCAICLRLRRGNFYRVASEEECSLFSLGTHHDYILETFFLNLFNGSYLGTMPNKLINYEGDLFVYRPLAHVYEKDFGKVAQLMSYPIIPYHLCRFLDGLQR